jgi:hypothetical protein
MDSLYVWAGQRNGRCRGGRLWCASWLWIGLLLGFGRRLDTANRMGCIYIRSLRHFLVLHSPPSPTIIPSTKPIIVHHPLNLHASPTFLSHLQSLSQLIYIRFTSQHSPYPPPLIASPPRPPSHLSSFASATAFPSSDLVASSVSPPRPAASIRNYPLCPRRKGKPRDVHVGRRAAFQSRVGIFGWRCLWVVSFGWLSRRDVKEGRARGCRWRCVCVPRDAES